MSLCKFRSSARSGVTLIELLIFIAVLAIVIGLTIPILFQNGTNQVRQESFSLVERNGAQILTNLGLHIRDSERILLPAAGSSGYVLALQRSEPQLHPTIVALSGSTLVMIQGSTIQVLSAPEVDVQSFQVRNTSASDSRQSIYLSFVVRQRFQLTMSGSTVRYFNTTYTLYPHDVLVTQPCSCAAPSCGPANTFNWGYCNGASCVAQTKSLRCLP